MIYEPTTIENFVNAVETAGKMADEQADNTAYMGVTTRSTFQTSNIFGFLINLNEIKGAPAFDFGPYDPAMDSTYE